MLDSIASVAVEVVKAILPDLIAAVKQGGTDQAIRRRVLIKARRRAIEAAHDALAKQLRKVK